MEKTSLQINDFQLFCDTLQNMTKITGNLKITIDKTGMSSSFADKDEIIRVDLTSTSVSLPKTSNVENVSLCTKSLEIFSQILLKIQKAHTSKTKKNVDVDFSDVSITLDNTNIYIKSSTLKTNLFLDNEVAVHTLNPFKHILHPIAEVSTSSDDIKEVMSTTFIFKQSDKIIVSIGHQDDMVRNIAYAHISDPLDPRSNDVVTKFGNIICGEFSRDVLIDIPRLKFISLFSSNDIKVKFNREPCFNCEFSSKSKMGYATQYVLTAKYVANKK